MTYQRRVLEALRSLDADQSTAVGAICDQSQGNLRISATAGSGKTRVLITALARLLVLDNLSPLDIVATTFTRKAGDELKGRLASLIPDHILNDLPVGTFHSLSLSRLRSSSPPGTWQMSRCVDVPGREEDIPSALTIWRRIVGWHKDGVPGTGERSIDVEGGIDPKTYSTAIDVLRSHGLVYTGKEGKARARASQIPELHTAWAMYEESKLALGAWDFGDALFGLYEGLVEGRILWTPRVVLVDECQDNSKLQLDIARKLSEAKGSRLIIVGDGSQAIYAWRGAYPQLFAEAETAISATTYTLPNNYRSGSKIVDIGNRVMFAIPAKWRSKDLARAARDGGRFAGTVEVLSHREYDGEWAEAIAVAEDIVESIPGPKIPTGTADPRYEKFAILVRTNSAAEAFEGALMSRGIPCIRQGGKPFWERYDTLNFLAYCVLSELDSWEAFARVVNVPKRYLGKAYLQAVAVETERHKDLGLLDNALNAARTARGGGKTKARDFARLVQDWRKMDWKFRVTAVHRLLETALPREEGAGDAPDESRARTLDQCARVALRFGDGVALAQYADACTKNALALIEQSKRAEQKQKGRVTISTVHRAKSLEWPVVYVSIPEDVFPHMRGEPDEEMRLAYVAFTRARDRLVVTHGGDPSELLDFVEEEFGKRGVVGG